MPRIDLIQIRRNTAAGAAASNPVLYVGEMGYETDTLKHKFGDGVTAWNDLPYASADIDLSNIESKEVADTGTTIVLDTIGGTNSNFDTPNSNTSFTINNTADVLNSWNRVKINASTEPTITGATQEGGIDFIADTDLYLIVVNNGNEVNYAYQSLDVSSGGASVENIYTVDGTISENTGRLVSMSDGSYIWFADDNDKGVLIAGDNFSASYDYGFVTINPEGVSLGSQKNTRFRLGNGTDFVTPTVGQVLAAKDVNGNLEWVDQSSDGVDVIDDDTFATATSSNVPSAESVKAYVDAEVTNATGGAAPNGDVAEGETSAVSGGTVYDYINSEVFYIVNTENLFDNTDYIVGYYSTSNGTSITSNSTYITSGNIEIDPTLIYKRTASNTTLNVYFYDATETFISYDTDLDNIPSNTQYVRCTFLSADLDTAMFTLNSVDTSSYIPFQEYKFNAEKFENFYSDTDKGIVDALGITEVFTDNLINKETFSLKSLSASDGVTPTGSTAYSTSDYFEIDPDTKYKKVTTMPLLYTYWYDGSYTFISATSDEFPESPSTAVYARAVFPSGELETAMFTKFSVDNSFYQPYTLKKISDDILIRENYVQDVYTIDKTCYWLGDSITANENYYLEELNQKLQFTTQYNLAVAGATWSHDASTTTDLSGTQNGSNNVIWNQVNRMIDLVDNSGYEIPEVVFISCGNNDMTLTKGTPSTVYDGADFIGLASTDTEVRSVAGGIRYSCDNLLTEYPDVQIILIAPIQRGVADASDMLEVSDTMQECASYGSMEVIDQTRKSGIYGYFEYVGDKYLSDNIHPNAAGGTKIANFLYKAIKNIIIE